MKTGDTGKNPDRVEPYKRQGVGFFKNRKALKLGLTYLSFNFFEEILDS